MKTLKWYALGGFAVLFSLLFWEEKMALNYVIFTWLSLTFLHFAYEAQWTRNRIFLLGAHVVSSFSLIYVHSGFAMVMSILTWMLSMGATHQSKAQSPLLSLLSSLDALVYLPIHTEDFGDGKMGKTVGKTLRTLYKYRMVAFLFAIFLLLFAIANMAFQDLFMGLLSDFFQFLEVLFREWNADRFMFTGLGALIAMWFIFAGKDRSYISWEMKQGDFLRRIRRVNQTRAQFSPVQLLITKRVFHYSFVALNLLLLLVNSLDLAYVWFKSDFSCRECLSKDVHFGVEILIFSILLASALVLIAFRGNLNFIRNNRGLRHAAVVWIAQNLFLLISVAIRNAHYVNMHGLTYKRIGVFIFLILVAIGLCTLLLKVIQVRTLYYVSQLNAFAWVLVLCLSASVNWDRVIFNYNTQSLHLENTDYHYLLSLSDEIQPDLYALFTEKGFHLAEEEMVSYRPERNYTYSKDDLVAKCAKKLKDFRLNDKHSWLSFNGRDYRVRKKLAQ